MTSLSTTDDEVLHLREWGTDRLYPLPPETPVREHFVGSAAECGLRLVNRCVAPRHATLVHQWHRWRIRALAKATPLRHDGEHCSEVILRPGVEVGIASITLVAESARSVALRAFCARLLGWSGDRVVDHALRAIRLATAQRAALVLRGEGNLIPIARALHRRALGEHAPFIVCDRQRPGRSVSRHSPTRHASGVVAYKAAAGGTLCLPIAQPPSDLPLLRDLLYEPQNTVQLIVCVDARRTRLLPLVGPPIDIPSLSTRELDLPRIVEEYADDAIQALQAPVGCFAPDDRWWVMEHARSFAEIEQATLRLVMVKVAPTLGEAATRLGITEGTLSCWLKHRSRLPFAARGESAKQRAAVDMAGSAPKTKRWVPRSSKTGPPKTRFCWRCETGLRRARHRLLQTVFGLLWLHEKCAKEIIAAGEAIEDHSGQSRSIKPNGQNAAAPQRAPQRALRSDSRRGHARRTQ